jgi:D-sedoheptulose 7-phosphate isomerase
MTILKTFLSRSIDIKQSLLNDAEFQTAFAKACTMLRNTAEHSGTIYLAGNGGSACDAMHFCEELTARYKRERRGIRAMHFLDAGAITCWSNDYSYESYFERQVQTFCGPNDCFIPISTSGNSKNLVRATQHCAAQNIPTIGLLGKDGGALRELVTVPLVVSAEETDRIQEVHILIIHAFCEFLES